MKEKAKWLLLGVFIACLIILRPQFPKAHAEQRRLAYKYVDALRSASVAGEWNPELIGTVGGYSRTKITIHIADTNTKQVEIAETARRLVTEIGGRAEVVDRSVPWWRIVYLEVIRKEVLQIRIES